MAGDEVHAGRGFASGGGVEVGRAHDALHHFTDHAGIAFEEASGAVAVFAVPFHPTPVGGEVADLIEPTRIPSLGDEFAVGQHGIVREKFQERGIRQRGPLGVASENGGKIEAEAVDMVFRRPVAEAVDNEFANGGVVAVNGVSAARVVCEGALLVENIPGFVIDAAEGEDGSISTAFGRVIKNDIQHDLDARLVEGGDHFLHFPHGEAFAGPGGVAGFRSEEADRAIPPVIAERVAGDRICAMVFRLIEFKNRHEFDAIHTEIFQIGRLFSEAGKGSWVFDSGAIVAREAAEVHFVNDEVVVLDSLDAAGLQHLDGAGHSGAEDGLVGVRGFAHPLFAAHNLTGIGIEEDFGSVEKMTIPRAHRAVEAESVFQIFEGKIMYDHRPDMPEAVFRREGDFGHRGFDVGLEENERTGGRVRTEDREIDARRHMAHAKGQKMPAAQLVGSRLRRLDLGCFH